MEPNDVLKKFIDVCSNKDDKCTRYSFASNGILEWFGRNIKDNNKIFEYIRYNLSHQYEHIFSVAIRCDAFEEKPLHRATRRQPSDTITNVDSSSKSDDVFETPPSSSATKESDDMTTPERKKQQDASKIHEFSDTDDEPSFPRSPRITRSAQKRCSDAPYPQSPSKRNRKTDHKESEQLRLNAETSELPDPSKNTEIKYIEAVGTVRKLRKLKHRGIDSRSKEIRIYESPTGRHWESGNTKLKISYRENVNQSDLQFVLVIYQHIDNSPRCRRDLMTEFAKTCSDETTDVQKSEKKGKTNKNLKMRRLRF
ncbi:uncharacterized protein LOC119070551 [Bradysia coprophila]|uniref:uncharacterized protein LOC119070551 n=1 Tax=Bradysia coprophila TaxID=38358 RepID=UPI00187D700A|nr:uncharacterized protein LOC119070551 [Bradysia coprophila]XP_037030844.1 uncharacterized protein LOC119070551 [Bradysia coprophila]